MKVKNQRLLTITFVMLSLLLVIISNQKVSAEAKQDSTVYQLSYVTVGSGGVSSKTLQPLELIDDEEPVAETMTSSKVNASGFARYTGNYGYNTLSTKGKNVYKALVKAATSFHNGGKNARKVTYRNGTTGYTTGIADLSNYSVYISELAKIAFAFEADYPMFYWYDGVTFQTENGKVVKAYLTVNKSYYKASTRSKVQAAINKGLKPYSSMIDTMKRKGASNYEIELAVHDLLISKCTYSLDSSGRPEAAAWAHNIYGIFGKNTAVCQGYAKAFQMLMHYAHIDSIYAIGTAGSTYEGHAWNLVKHGGVWYAVDTTWDDVDDYEASLGTGVMYNYFNCSTYVFSRDHFYDYEQFPEMYKMPAANLSDTYWYYSYYNLKENFSSSPTDISIAAAFKNAITKIESNGQYRLRFAIDNTYMYGNDFYARLSNSYSRQRISDRISTNGRTYIIDRPSIGLNTSSMSPYTFIYVPVSYNVVNNIRNNADYFDSYQYKVISTSAAGVSDITSKTTRTVQDGELVISYNGIEIGRYNVTAKAVTVSPIAAESFNGKAHTPKPVVKIGDQTLVEGTDYTLSYSNNINAGSASVIITGKGRYQGKKVVTFTINPISLNGCTIAAVSPKTYTGGAIVPTLTVANPNGSLVNKANYSITCKNNVNVGTATVTVTGKHNYTGTLKTTFTIAKRNISTCKVGSIAEQSYTGKSLTPSVKIMIGGKTTLKTSDYKLKFSGNKKPGRAKVVLTGIGANCTGTKTVYFNIVPKKVSGVKVSSYKKRVVVKWNTSAYATGYKVYYATSKNGTYKSWGDTNKKTLTKSGLKKGKTYYVKVRAYKTIDGKKKFGKYSSIVKIVVK